MSRRVVSSLLCWFALAHVAAAAPLAVQVELATEPGVQITAPQQWLQLLAGVGIHQVQIRSKRSGDEPAVTNRGTPARPSYKLVGILTRRDELLLPGAVLRRSDRAELKDYFDRLGADGAESLTAARGKFGLTVQELEAVAADLSQSISFETKDQSPRAVLDRVEAGFVHKLALAGDAERVLRDAKPLEDELKGISAGTAIAMLLRNHGLVVRPEKLRGHAARFRVEALAKDSVGHSTLGITDAPEITYWPIGWQPEKALGELAPSLRETFNAEIDGYSVDEVLAAISPRLAVPLYRDHAALARFKIEPAKVQVSLPRTRLSYKRLLDRVLAQARLGCSLRVDENGKPFLWVTR